MSNFAFKVSKTLRDVEEISLLDRKNCVYKLKCTIVLIFREQQIAILFAGFSVSDSIILKLRKVKRDVFIYLSTLIISLENIFLVLFNNAIVIRTTNNLRYITVS